MEETKGLKSVCASLVFLIFGCLVLTVKCQTDLVTDVQCYIHSSKLTNCSWQPVGHVPDLQFFYKLIENEIPAKELDAVLSKVPDTPCPAYDYKDDVKTGCRLQNISPDKIDIIFKGTVNGTIVKQSVSDDLFYRVRAPPLNWTVEKQQKQFFISWTAPDIPSISYWTYRLNYTECGEQKTKTQRGGTSMELDFVPRCRYSMSIKAFRTEELSHQSEESDVKHFEAEAKAEAEAEAESDPTIYAFILIPAMFVVLVVMALVCFRKHKEKIFPKVPEPRDLIRDIFDNNNMSKVNNLYIPAQEEEDCKITLVGDPQLITSDSSSTDDKPNM